jgi:hypothetical protein
MNIGIRTPNPITAPSMEVENHFLERSQDENKGRTRL